MTKKRMGFLQALLPFIGLGGRLRLEWISSAEANRFVQVVTEFTGQIRNLGPSPLSQGQTRPFEALELPPLPQAAVGGGCGCSRQAV